MRSSCYHLSELGCRKKRSLSAAQRWREDTPDASKGVLYGGGAAREIVEEWTLPGVEMCE